MSKLYNAARKVLEILNNAGFESYFVGGCVRDLCLDREPKDYDITTIATPEQVRPLFKKSIPVGARFGVVVVMVDGYQFEIATYRSDGAYSDGRRPDEVTYSTQVKHDVQRRDFTINGMLIADPFAAVMTDYSLAVVDYVGGRADLEAKLIRCIGDPQKRFEEDALRMMRAVRFAAQLGFEIEEETFKAIVKNVKLLKRVSRERITEEFLKLLTAKHPVKGLVPLASSGLLSEIFDAVFVSKLNFPETLRRFQLHQTLDPVMALTMFLADSSVLRDAPTRHIKEALNNFFRLPSQSVDKIAGALVSLTVMDTLHFFSKDRLVRVLRSAGAKDIAIPVYLQIAEGDTTFLHEARNIDLYPTPLLTGQDLIDMGLTPSPLFTQILSEVETKQLNGEYTTKDEALRYAQASAEYEKERGHDNG